MSRYEVTHKDKGLAFGCDHACGEFLMIWSRPGDNKERAAQDRFGPSPEEILVDEDRFTDFTREKMESLIAEHGFTLEEMERAERVELGKHAIRAEDVLTPEEIERYVRQ